MNFGQALEILKHGGAVQRTGWNGKGLWLCLQTPDANSKMTLPYIYLCYPSDADSTPGARVPWAPSQTDVLAEDWKPTEDSVVVNVVEPHSGLPPHQQRVLVEHNELADKISKLELFIVGSTYAGLRSVEQGRLSVQLEAMYRYCAALKARISDF